MKNIFSIVGEAVYEIGCGIRYFFEVNLYNFGLIIEIAAPYIMYYLSAQLTLLRGKLAVGGEVFLPLVLMIFASFIKKCANKKGKGYRLPINRKRFTSEDEWGEVTISEDDIQEIILYLNDVENYIEKRGWNRWER